MDENLKRSHFLTDIIDADLAAGKNGGKVVTRFPPEPNGFLHIGHAKSIVLNFGIALQYRGRAHLRFDDTNPTTEEAVYVEAIQKDVRWLGFDWGSHLYFASDFFDKMHGCAIRLIKEGKAYVDSQSVEDIRLLRGSFERPGEDSPFRGRSVEENLQLFERMRKGDFKDGECVLRAKIDMAHPNVLMRDPLLYRIRHAHHHRTQDKWCIYPMYDFAHPLEDAFEGVTHSFCTLEFESNRELYDWVLDNLGPWDPRPRQYEFARLALGYTVLSKRKLLQLVNEKRVSGWDDPRMPTMAGMRRRGVTPEALREFCELIGVAKNNSTVDIGKFEFAVRSDVEKRAAKAMVVLRPLKLVITSLPEGYEAELSLPWWPGEVDKGARAVPIGRELFIERDDFSLNPPKDWKRLAPGKEVRLIGAFAVKCEEVVQGPDGEVLEVRCSHDAQAEGRKIPGAIHWVHAKRSVPLPVRLYDRLFAVEEPDTGDDFLQNLNPESLVVAGEARGEPALSKTSAGERYQFLRQGYFFVDPVDSKPGAPVFNRIISLKDSWASKSAVAAAGEARPERKKDSPPKGAAQPKKEPKVRSRSAESQVRYDKFQQLGLSEEESDVLARDETTAAFFEQAVAAHSQPRSVSKWLTNELLGLSKDKPLSALPLSAAEFGHFVGLVDSGKVPTAAAKALLARLVESGGSAEKVAAEMDIAKPVDGQALSAAVHSALAALPREVERYRAGEKKLIGVFVGAVMRETKGAADAAAVRKAIETSLSGKG